MRNPLTKRRPFAIILWYDLYFCNVNKKRAKLDSIEMWLSLVERHVRDVEAAGSNPVISTIKKEPPLWRFFLYVQGGADQKLHRHTYYEYAPQIRCGGKGCRFCMQNDAVKASRHSLGVCGNAAESGANPVISTIAKSTRATLLVARVLFIMTYTPRAAAQPPIGSPRE